MDLPDGCPQWLEGARGEALEIVAELDPGEAQEVGLAVRVSPDRREETRVVYDTRTRTLRVDRSRSTLRTDLDPRESHDPKLDLAPGEPLRLHLFLDHSVLEIFAEDGRVSYTTRVYPTRGDSRGVYAFAEGGSAQLRSLQVWRMASIWPRGDRPSATATGTE